MTPGPDPFDFGLLTIAVMAVVTFLIRAGGFLVMGFVPIGPRLRRMLEALPGAIVAATVLPIAAGIGTVAWLAVVAAIGVMIAIRSALLGVIAGVAVAAGARALGL